MGRTDQYTEILCPAKCFINVPFLLKIQIRLCSLQNGITITSDRGNKKIVRLLVCVTAPTFDMPLSTAWMNVPPDKDSDSVVYHMVPEQIGVQHIEIEMFLGCDRVGYMIVSPHVYENDHVE